MWIWTKSSSIVFNTMSKFRPVSHCIFDVDGLLLDTERLYTEMMQTICSDHGKQFTWEIKVKQMGRKIEEAAKILIDELDLPITVDDYKNRLAELQEELFAKAALLPGAERLVKHLSSCQVPLAVATGSNQLEFALKSQSHKPLFALFHHCVLAGTDPEVKQSKPAPDCFLVAAARFPDKPAPAQVLVFEDAVNGVAGALAAGMQVVWVPDERADKALFEGHKDVLIINSLNDFQPELFGLPPFPLSSV